MTLGILGGLGPSSTVYFYEMLTCLTRARCDQEHLDIVISSRASTPDRTAYILGMSDKNPVIQMTEDAKRLENFGCDVIAIPCNTAHFFYDTIAENVSVPVLNIISVTTEAVKKSGGKTMGILATEGTVKSRSYHLAAEKAGISCIEPTKAEQKVISSIIYDDIKKGRTPDIKSFMRVADALFSRGADRLVLGCTELSLLCKENSFDSRFVDSLRSLAEYCIRYCERSVSE